MTKGLTEADIVSVKAQARGLIFVLDADAKVLVFNRTLQNDK